MSHESQTQPETKACSQCNKLGTKGEFANKQWKKPNPSCRLCAAFTRICQDKTRVCHGCQVDLPRINFDICQWGKGDEALCHSCRDALTPKVLASGNNTRKELSDGTCVCIQHSLESCDICMLDFTLSNDFQRKRNSLGRDLTQEEYYDVTKESTKDIRINRKICIMDGHAVCPRSCRKLRCDCGEVTYCSQACRDHHWPIHKMTCKVYAETRQKKAEAKKASKAKKKQGRKKSTADDLTERQKTVPA